MARMTKRRGDLMQELTTVFRGYQRSVDALDEVASEIMGVNRTDARVLDLVEENERLTAGEIAEQAGLTSGAVTGVLDRLERAGYVRRTRDDTDRRRVIVEKTPKLTEQVEAIYAPFQPKGEAMMSKYTDEELVLMTQVMREAAAVTDEHAAELRARGPSRGSRA